MGGRGGGGGADDKLVLSSSGQATWREMAGILAPYFWPKELGARLRALSCFALLGASKVTNVLAPVQMGIAVDQLIAGRMPAEPILLFGVLRLLTSAFEEGQRLVYLRVKEIAYADTAAYTFGHLHSLSLQWHLTKRVGVVLRAMDRGLSAGNTIVDMLFLRLVPTIIEALVLTVLFATMYGSPAAAAVLCGSFFAYVAATVLLTRWRTKIRTSMNRLDNESASIAQDTLSAAETVKAFTTEEWEVKRYSTAVRAFQAASRSSQASLVALNLTQATILRAAVTGVMLVAAADVLRGSGSVGDFIALQTFISQLFQPLSWLGTLYTMIVAAATDMSNLADLWHEQSEVVEPPGAPRLRLHDRAKGVHVEFRDVWFAYPAAHVRVERSMQAVADREGGSGGGSGSGSGLHMMPRAAVARLRQAVHRFIQRRRGATQLQDSSTGGSGSGSSSADAVAVQVDPAAPASASASQSQSQEQGERWILKGVSFTIKPGTTTALVGSTGSGKSSCCRLLLRLYDVSRGCVLVDGQDVRSVGSRSLREHIGLVPQDTVLFNDTLKFNLRYGRQDATDAEVEGVVAAAQLSPFVSQLPGGLATKVGERGLKLSGGEKQRVAIARALLKDPPILIFDEATASLDSITEGSLMTAIDSVRRGRTVLVVAHRLSTIMDADEIIVLERGEVVERGTHAALLAAQGRYAALWQQQSQSHEEQAGDGGGGGGGEAQTGDSAHSAHGSAAAAATLSRRRPAAPPA